MKTQQHFWKKGQWQQPLQSSLQSPQLVLGFGSPEVLKNTSLFEEIKKTYPQSHLLLCSTAGEIFGTQVFDGTFVLTAIEFEKTTLEFVKERINNSSESREVGRKLIERLPKDHLTHTLVFAEGVNINGSALIEGINSGLPAQVAATGGLVGDGPNFKETVIGFDELPNSGNVVLIGLYGEHIKIGYGSLGGWDTFGPERIVTKSKEHILYELDGKNALALYKEYLGERAKDLPSSGLLFPLSLKVTTNQKEHEVVRTLLAVSEADQSMTFAGDLPEGSTVKLMKANFERLIDGAGGAATMSLEPLGQSKPDLALLISCIGRKLVLGERIEEEIEAVSSIVGSQATLCGFYSYGEICPTTATEKQCQLHNQTMTITTLRED